MKSSLILLLLIISATIATAEFPNIVSHIQLTWLGTDISNKIDSTQTKSYMGNITYFTFCGEFCRNGSRVTCTSDFSYKVETGDRVFSDSGTAKSTVLTPSEIGSQYCLQFYNYIPKFKDVYDVA